MKNVCAEHGSKLYLKSFASISQNFAWLLDILKLGYSRRSTHNFIVHIFMFLMSEIMKDNIFLIHDPSHVSIHLFVHYPV